MRSDPVDGGGARGLGARPGRSKGPAVADDIAQRLKRKIWEVGDVENSGRQATNRRPIAPYNARHAQHQGTTKNSLTTRPSREVSDARRMCVLGSLRTSVRLFHRAGTVGFHGRAIRDGYVHDLAGLGYGRERLFGLPRRVCQHIGTKIQVVVSPEADRAYRSRDLSLCSRPYWA